MTNFAFSAASTANGVRRSSAQRSRPEQRWRIEGEYVTITEIGQRVGVSVTVASGRLRRLQKASGAITWARLATP